MTKQFTEAARIDIHDPRRDGPVWSGQYFGSDEISEVEQVLLHDGLGGRQDELAYMYAPADALLGGRYRKEIGDFATTFEVSGDLADELAVTHGIGEVISPYGDQTFVILPPPVAVGIEFESGEAIIRQAKERLHAHWAILYGASGRVIGGNRLKTNWFSADTPDMDDPLDITLSSSHPRMVGKLAGVVQVYGVDHLDMIEDPNTLVVANNPLGIDSDPKRMFEMHRKALGLKRVIHRTIAHNESEEPLIESLSRLVAVSLESSIDPMERAGNEARYGISDQVFAEEFGRLGHTPQETALALDILRPYTPPLI